MDFAVPVAFHGMVELCAAGGLVVGLLVLTISRRFGTAILFGAVIVSLWYLSDAGVTQIHSPRSRHEWQSAVQLLALGLLVGLWAYLVGRVLTVVVTLCLIAFTAMVVYLCYSGHEAASRVAADLHARLQSTYITLEPQLQGRTVAIMLGLASFAVGILFDVLLYSWSQSLRRRNEPCSKQH